MLNAHHPMRRIHACGLAALALLLLPACSPYQLKGRVIEGATPALVVVNSNDSRLQGYGMPGAVVESVLDPDRPLQQIPLDPVLTDANGYFAIPITATGAGLLEYNIEITARLAQHTPVQRTFKLPGLDKRVLIIIAPGIPGNSGNPGESTLPPRQGNILEETRRMGEQLQR